MNSIDYEQSQTLISDTKDELLEQIHLELKFHKKILMHQQEFRRFYRESYLYHIKTIIDKKSS